MFIYSPQFHNGSMVRWSLSPHCGGVEFYIVTRIGGTLWSGHPQFLSIKIPMNLCAEGTLFADEDDEVVEEDSLFPRPTDVCCLFCSVNKFPSSHRIANRILTIDWSPNSISIIRVGVLGIINMWQEAVKYLGHMCMFISQYFRTYLCASICSSIDWEITNRFVNDERWLKLMR